MASPQTDKGFIMIATDLHIAIAAARLGEAESLVLGVALHQLYGPRKLAVATLSAAEIAKGAGLNKSNVIRARRSLVARNILEETEGGYRFVKDYETWTFNGRPLLTPTMVGYAATFVPDIRPRKGKGVSQKTPEGVAEDTPGVSQKTPEGVAEDTPGCRRRHPAAPALYRNADLKTPEDLRRPRRDGRESDSDTRGRTDTGGFASGREAVAAVPPQPEGAERLRKRVEALIFEATEDESAAEAYGKQAVDHLRAGRSEFAVVEAFKRAVAEGVTPAKIGYYAGKVIATVEAKSKPSASDKPRPAAPASNIHRVDPETRRLKAEQQERKRRAMEAERAAKGGSSCR